MKGLVIRHFGLVKLESTAPQLSRPAPAPGPPLLLSPSWRLRGFGTCPRTRPQPTSQRTRAIEKRGTSKSSCTAASNLLPVVLLSLSGALVLHVSLLQSEARAACRPFVGAFRSLQLLPERTRKYHHPRLYLPCLKPKQTEATAGGKNAGRSFFNKEHGAGYSTPRRPAPRAPPK